MPTPSPNFLTCPIEPPSPSSPKAEPPQPKKKADKIEPPRTEKKDVVPPVRRSIKRWIVLGVIGVATFMLLPALISGVRAGVAAYAARSSVRSAQEKLQALDVRGAKSDLENAGGSLSAVRDALRMMGFWRDAPGVGTQVRAVEDAAAAGAGTLDSAVDMLSIAEVIVQALQGGTDAQDTLAVGIAPTRSFSELSKDEKRDLLQKFSNELPRLRLARDKMDLALELWNRVPQDQLASPFRKALQPLAETLPILRQALDEAVPLIEVIVPMAGYPEPRRYLIALQNDDEIRPGGGFIGTIGTMTWDAGEMSEFAFTDIYTIDNPVSGVWKETPPDPIQKYLGLSQWFLRDANWSPDFPTSAERILDFYIRESELQLHAELPHRPTAFIALEPGFFVSLLQLTGPITVEGETYDATNFFEKLEYKVEVEWHQKGIPVDKRKEVISKMGEELKKKIFALPASRWPELLDLTTKALERKQIMAYSRETDLQKLFESRGWTARAKPTQGDFLWVVDANLAALKTDGAMQKNVRYSIDATDPEGPTATVTLTYTNTAKGFGDYRYTRYRTYTRVYVPEGSQLISSTGAMKDDLHKSGGRFLPGTVDVMKELGKTVYGAFWSIEPSKSRTLSFTYRLPKEIARSIQAGTYRLDWQKQPGVDEAGLTLDLLFGKNIKAATPPEDAEKWGDGGYEYDTDSLTDRSFTISF